MNRVQELIDENKAQMPTALAKRLLDACKAEADAKPKLYRIVVTRVTSVVAIEDDTAVVKLQDLTQSLIVELVDRFDIRFGYDVLDLLGKGMLSEAWLDKPVPFVVNRDDHMLVVHSIVPYVPKRAREE